MFLRLLRRKQIKTRKGKVFGISEAEVKRAPCEIDSLERAGLKGFYHFGELEFVVCPHINHIVEVEGNNKDAKDRHNEEKAPS